MIKVPKYYFDSIASIIPITYGSFGQIEGTGIQVKCHVVNKRRLVTYKDANGSYKEIYSELSASIPGDISIADSSIVSYNSKKYDILENEPVTINGNVLLQNLSLKQRV
jgi:hypothetical protein